MLEILNEYSQADDVQEFKNTWRIFDGVGWRFAFENKPKAKRFAKQFKGQAIGYAIEVNNKLAYKQVEVV